MLPLSVSQSEVGEALLTLAVCLKTTCRYTVLVPTHGSKLCHSLNTLHHE
jgi:hypothetical protein